MPIPSNNDVNSMTKLSRSFRVLLSFSEPSTIWISILCSKSKTYIKLVKMIKKNKSTIKMLHKFPGVWAQAHLVPLGFFQLYPRLYKSFAENIAFEQKVMVLLECNKRLLQ